MAPPDAYARPRGAALPPREGRRGPPSPSRLGCPTAIRGGERTFQHPSAHLGRASPRPPRRAEAKAKMAKKSRTKPQNRIRYPKKQSRHCGLYQELYLRAVA